MKCYVIPLNNYGKGLVMDKKDENVWKVATKYVEDLRSGAQPQESWRDYWAVEGKILAQKAGK